MYATLPYVLLSVFINTTAQLLLKLGMERIGVFQLQWQTLGPLLLKVAVNPFIILGMFCYMASVGSWLVVLSRVDVSYAYPLVSFGYILTAFAGYFWFQESLSFVRISGILVIMLGVYLITRS
jgi:multidrug transporter EmrE-like cation transporter